MEGTEETEPVEEKLIGLDGEMSNNDLASGSRLIQAGFAARVGGELKVFSTLISWEEMDWSERAFQVHGITRKQLQDAPTPAQADAACEAWLLENGGVPGRRSLVAVGFNVVAFDLPFFRQALPQTMTLISRRGVDLNAACFTMDGWDPDPGVKARTWKGWKRSMKRQADTQLAKLGVAGQAHDAGWDAAQALVGLEWLQAQLRTTARPGRFEARPGQDPELASIFGAGLLARLEPVLSKEDLKELAELVEQACRNSGRKAGVLLGRRRESLEGSSLLDLLTSGQVGWAMSILAQDK